MPETSKAGLGLFAYDFDAATEGVIVLDEPDPTEQAPPPPTEAMVAQAREEGFREGLAHGRAEAASAREAALADMTSRLSDQMTAAAAALHDAVEQAGTELAQLVLAAVGSAFPALSARHGGAEVQRFARDLMALLADEPRIVVRVNPDMAADIDRVLAALDPERRAAVAVETRDTLAPGDARIAWRHGLAVRDAAGAWARVTDALAPLGLAPPPAAAPGPAGRHMAPAA